MIVIPLVILGEAVLDKAALRLIPQFIGSGLIDASTRPRFEAALRAVRRWRDASLPWVFLLGAALAWTLLEQPESNSDAFSWALDDGGGLGFGGSWYAFVVRPMFIALLLGWLWRILLLVALFARFARIGRLGLSLVPTHPDGAGGLGFLETFPGAFAPVTFALSPDRKGRCPPLWPNRRGPTPGMPRSATWPA